MRLRSVDLMVAVLTETAREIIMLDLPPDVETMRHLVKKLTIDIEAIKADLQAANAAIDDLRTEVANLKTAQIARGHDPD